MIQAIMSVAAEYWECIALRKKQLSAHALEPNLQEVGAGQCPELEDTASCSSTF
jgi:hypothetical protein